LNARSPSRDLQRVTRDCSVRGDPTIEPRAALPGQSQRTPKFRQNDGKQFAAWTTDPLSNGRKIRHLLDPVLAT
jgi:hypothetical protein